jgi:aryl-alcohol dehydrogenase-like predicted oxidoreductase
VDDPSTKSGGKDGTNSMLAENRIGDPGSTPAHWLSVAVSSGGMITSPTISKLRPLRLKFREENSMRQRPFGRTGWLVSEIGFGSWAIGSAWGSVKDEESLDALRVSLDNGVDFLDTADVYGDDHKSERLIAGILKERRKQGKAVPIVATKLGRRLPKQDAAQFTYANLAPFVEASLKALEVDVLDLTQLHCPPIETYYRPEVFEAMDRLQREGKIRFYGVSVEKVEEGLKALEYPGVVSVQIIYNMFRQRPDDSFLELAHKRGVAVLARVPLASGLLTGKFKPSSTFEASDHRQFNRHGEAFDVGETFAGVPYETGLAAVEELRALVPQGATMAQFALRWILMNEAVSVVIPGAKNAEQARANLSAEALAPLSPDTMARVGSIYETRIKPSVHQRW